MSGLKDASKEYVKNFAITLNRKLFGFHNVVLAFCGNGFKWHVDELEDFVAFYYSEHHRQDDPFRKMELFDLEQNSVTMTRRIDRFAYFGRRDTNILEN